MIVLQYWFDFYHTSTWINHRCTCIPSLLSLPPTFCLFPLDYYRAPVWVSWVIQPIPTGYLFTNINVYTSMLLSPFISHSASSSPPSSINLFSMSVSPLLLCGQILQYHLSCCRVWLFATPWTAAHQASLFITNSRSLLKLMSIKLVLPSDHLILYCPLLLLPSFFPSFRVFSNELAGACASCRFSRFQITGKINLYTDSNSSRDWKKRWKNEYNFKVSTKSPQILRFLIWN